MFQVYVSAVFSVVLSLFSLSAPALEVESGITTKFFKVSGKTVSAAEATKADDQGKPVVRCSPKKTKSVLVDADGKPIAVAFECKEVKRVLNANTGNTTWKTK